MPSAAHNELVRIGARWLKKQGFPIVATEIFALGSREQPDIVGFRATCSAVIEAKVSRSDFLADLKKPERMSPQEGVGVYRFYLCPPGIIGLDDLPAGWGLLHAADRMVHEVRRPPGNVWPPRATATERWLDFTHPVNMDAERSILYSIARRQAAGKPI